MIKLIDDSRRNESLEGRKQNSFRARKPTDRNFSGRQEEETDLRVGIVLCDIQIANRWEVNFKWIFDRGGI